MTCNGDSLLGSAATLSYADVQQLWINNGGPPGWAPLMAGIAMAESGGRIGILNDCPDTGDYSVGLWQINYYGNLLSGRTQSYGSPQALSNDANAQAKAAISLFGNGAGIGNWKGDATYNAWQSAGAPQQPSAQTVQSWLGGHTGSSSGGSLGNATAGEAGGAATAQIGCSSNGGVGIFSARIGTQCQLKALAGGLMIGVGAGFLLMGAAILGSTALRRSGAGAAVSRAIPGPVGAAARRVTSGASRAGAPARTAATAGGRSSPRVSPGPTGAASSAEASTRPVRTARGITEREARSREQSSYALGHAAGHSEGHTEGILAERKATGRHSSGVSNAEVRRHRANLRGQSDGGFVRRGSGE